MVPLYIHLGRRIRNLSDLVFRPRRIITGGADDIGEGCRPGANVPERLHSWKSLD